MKYRLVMFDFDGTLADSFPWFVRVLNETAVFYRFRGVLETEIETLRGYSGRQLIAHLRVPYWKIPFVAQAMRRRMLTDINTILPFSGVETLLQDLAKEGVTLGIVSSNARENILRVLGAETAALIAHYECNVSLFGKGARLRKVLRKTGVFPHEALYIGDELRDLEAARRERIPFGAVSWGYTHPDALAARAPEEFFTTREEILDRILHVAS